mmetsp:Transcript_41594/g.98655  ORF Transcript_41594/g.98655 Transcript_41594/m.98655 type:complete len:234 (+) Transcript_41594:4075-4776(+)
MSNWMRYSLPAIRFLPAATVSTSEPPPRSASLVKTACRIANFSSWNSPPDASRSSMVAVASEPSVRMPETKPVSVTLAPRLPSMCTLVRRPTTTVFHAHGNGCDWSAIDRVYAGAITRIGIRRWLSPWSGSSATETMSPARLMASTDTVAAPCAASGLRTWNESTLLTPMAHTVSLASMSSSDSKPGRPAPSAKGVTYTVSVRFGSEQFTSTPSVAFVAFSKSVAFVAFVPLT